MKSGLSAPSNSPQAHDCSDHVSPWNVKRERRVPASVGFSAELGPLVEENPASVGIRREGGLAAPASMMEVDGSLGYTEYLASCDDQRI